MLNFSHHHSLKRRFQAVLTSLAIFNQDQLFLSKLIDDVVTGKQNSLSDPEVRAVILGLYHHQDLASLAEYFLESEYLVIALAIALSCRGEMQPRSFVSKVSGYLSNSDFNTQLKLANTLAEKGESRAIARSLIPENTLAYGIYCFLSTPYSWNLVNQGAGEFQISISAIASAYLGYIPNANSDQQKLGISMGDYLLAAWSGVYDLGKIPANFYPSIQFPEIMSLGA